MPGINVLGKQHGFGHTHRKDAWWVRPLIIFILLFVSNFKSAGFSSYSI